MGKAIITKSFEVNYAAPLSRTGRPVLPGNPILWKIVLNSFIVNALYLDSNKGFLRYTYNSYSKIDIVGGKTSRIKDERVCE